MKQSRNMVQGVRILRLHGTIKDVVYTVFLEKVWLKSYLSDQGMSSMNAWDHDIQDLWCLQKIAKRFVSTVGTYVIDC